MLKIGLLAVSIVVFSMLAGEATICKAECDIYSSLGILNAYCVGGGRAEDVVASSNDKKLSMSTVPTQCNEITKHIKTDAEKKKSDGDAVWNALWILKTQFLSSEIADTIKDIMEAESCGQSLIVDHTTVDIKRISNSPAYAQLFPLAYSQNWTAYRQLLNELYSNQCSNGYSWPRQPGAVDTPTATGDE